MTNGCRLFETLRESDAVALRDHARTCSDCATQLAAENALERILANESRPPVGRVPIVLRVRRRSEVRAVLAAGICAGALFEVVTFGSRLTWTPAVMLACAGCVALALVCNDLLTAD